MVDNPNTDMDATEYPNNPVDDELIPEPLEIPVDETTTDGTDRTVQQKRARNANIPAAPLDRKTADLLLRMYLSRRINYQTEFYQSRVREFDDNSDLMFRLGALVMSLSSLFAALSLQADSAVLRLITAILPAVAALIASFRQLYQWERQAGIYRDTVLGLAEAQLTVPDKDLWNESTGLDVYTELVNQAERVFQNEVSQWGQVAIGKPEEEAKQDAMRLFAEEYNLDIFNPDGTLDESKLGQLQHILGAGVGTPDSTIEIDYPALTQGTGATTLLPGDDELDDFSADATASPDITDPNDPTSPAG